MAKKRVIWFLFASLIIHPGDGRASSTGFPPLHIHEFPYTVEGELNEGKPVYGRGIGVTLKGPSMDLEVGKTYRYSVHIHRVNWDEGNISGFTQWIHGQGISQILIVSPRDSVELSNFRVKVVGKTSAETSEELLAIIKDGFVGYAKQQVKEARDKAIKAMENYALSGDPTLYIDIAEPFDYVTKSDFAIYKSDFQGMTEDTRFQNIEQIDVSFNAKYKRAGRHHIVIIPDIRATGKIPPFTGITAGLVSVYLVEYRQELIVTADALLSRQELAKRIRDWINVIEEKEKQALPGIEREERLRAEERRKEEEYERKIAETCRRLNEEENERVRRELADARDTLTRELLAFVHESEHRRADTAGPAVSEPQAGKPSTVQRSEPDRRAQDGFLTVKMWTVPSEISASEFWRTGSINVTLFYAASKDCDVEVYGQLNGGRIGWFTGAKLIHTERGKGGSWISAYSSPGGGGVRWSSHPPERIVAQRLQGGKTYSHSLGNVVIPPGIDKYARSGLSERPKSGERIQIQFQTTITIKASEGGRNVSDSMVIRAVP